MIQGKAEKQSVGILLLDLHGESSGLLLGFTIEQQLGIFEYYDGRFRRRGERHQGVSTIQRTMMREERGAYLREWNVRSKYH